MDNEELYIPESHMTLKMVKEVMGEFEWPIPYELIDNTEVIESVLIRFPKCEIELTDYADEGISMVFLTYDGGKEIGAESIDIIGYIDNYNPSEDLNLEYRGYKEPKEDTKKMIRNKMKNLRYYHMNFIIGEDYKWVERFLKEGPNSGF